MNTTDPIQRCPRCGAPIPVEAPQGLCPRCVFADAATAPDTGSAGPAAPAAGDLPPLERVQAAFPQLEVLELIGRGGMGFVFKARQPHLGRFVALKLLPDQLARDPRFTERFHREGRVLARLSHPNIVSVFDFGRAGPFYFLTLEYVDGVNLRQAMQAGRFSPAEALAIVPKICEALQYAHEQGVLHRDIKPENILLDARGRVKIADFGIAKLVEADPASETLTGTGAALGTPHYMAPEQLERPAEVDHRADIYSLGVVFYEMLTGELPIGRFAPPSARTPVNARVDDVVFRALEKDREKRFQSAGEVKTRVEHLAESGVATSAAAPPDPGEDGPRGAAAANPPGKPTYAFRAFAGAALVGISLAMPLTVVVALLTGRGGIAPIEFWLSLGSVALPGLGGTWVGWLALHEIRDGRGAVRGLPFALFASLTWPLLALLAVTLGPPMFWLTPDGGSGWTPVLGRMLVLLLPAGVLTFALWAVYTAARWAANRPAGERRGTLKWVFAGLLVCLYGIALMSRRGDSGTGVERPAPRVYYTPARPAGPEPIRLRFRVPKGQVATLEVLRRDTDPPVPVPFLAGYVVAPDDERGRAEFVLEPVTGIAQQTNPPAWTMKLTAEGGATVSGGRAELGPLISIVSQPPGSYLDFRPLTESEMGLTAPAATAEPNGPAAPAQLSLRVITHGRDFSPRKFDGTLVSIGSTNWVPSMTAPPAEPPLDWAPDLLAWQVRENPPGAATTNCVRFTLSGLDLRRQPDGRWLIMDFLAVTQGDVEPVIRLDGHRFLAVARTAANRDATTPNSTRHRIEWRVPDAAGEPELLAFRDALANDLVNHEVTVYESEQRPLFRLPIGRAGDLGVGLRAVRRSGAVTLTELLARPWALGRAKAILERAETNLAEVRQPPGENRANRLELLTAEAEHTAARMLFEAAAHAQNAPPPGPEAVAAARASDRDRWQSAVQRLHALRQKFQTDASPDQRELLDAEAEAAIAEAAFQGDALAVARARLEHASKVRTLVEGQFGAGQVISDALEHAQANEINAQAALTMWERMR